MAFKPNPLKNVQPVTSVRATNQRGKPKAKSMKLKKFNKGKTYKI